MGGEQANGVGKVELAVIACLAIASAQTAQHLHFKVEIALGQRLLPQPGELGFLAPPIGLNLLLSSYRFDKPIIVVMRAVLPMLIVLFLGVLLITYVPPLTTWLPSLVAPDPSAASP